MIPIKISSNIQNGIGFAIAIDQQNGEFTICYQLIQPQQCRKETTLFCLYYKKAIISIYIGRNK